MYSHRRSGHAVSIEELGLGLAAIAALAVPPASTVAIQNTASSTGNGDGSTGNADEGSFPLLVAEGSGALENDVGSALQASQVEGGTGRNSNIVKDNGGAGSLGLSGRRSTAGAAEGAGCGALVNR